jgi:allophanate hydrolase
MNFANIRSRLAAGESIGEIISGVLQAIKEWNDPALFLYQPPEEELLAFARQTDAQAAARPLRGIPFVVKDNIDVAGWPTTAGCPGYAYIAREDAECVRLLREAGAILIGKVNLDQFATGLVGTRSPHGTPRNAIAPDHLPGGSSSGSASAVAAGLCAFSLGTDTAGSGRVPAAFQELLGWKPTRGLVSGRGVVPACRSLDCVSVFTRNPADAAEVMGVLARPDSLDLYSKSIPQCGRFPRDFRFGVPASLDFADDPDTPGLFRDAIARLEAVGGKAVEVDLTPFLDAARLLYEGPWVAERWAAVGKFVETHPEEVFPITRAILEDSRRWDAASLFTAQDRLRELAMVAAAAWTKVDVLLLPTTPRLYTVEENLADPFASNAVLGRYTNFVNLLDLAAVAVPGARARAGTVPWGVTFIAPSGHDDALLDLAGRWYGEAVPARADVKKPRLPLAVCGAHMEGLPLHWQLADRGAVLRQRGKTSPCYRLYAMPASVKLPARPALVRDDEHGTAIAIEVWELEPSAFGEFVAAIPPPLGIGKVLLEDGREVPGFIAEPRAITGATEITSFGGWRAWLASAMPG